MRRTALAVAIFLAGVMPFGAEAGTRDFIVANSLPWPIESLFARQSGTERWSQDLFGDDVLPPGQRTTMRMGDGPPCIFDLRIAVRNGGGVNSEPVATWQRVDICALEQMTVTYNGQNFVATWRNSQ